MFLVVLKHGSQKMEEYTMPTPVQSYFPKTKSSEEFENIAKDCAKKHWKQNFSLYGRLGQAQHGIDIYSADFFIVIQCKNYTDNKKDTIEKFKQEISKDYKRAASKFPDIKLFVIATALDRNTDIQNFIRDLDKEKNDFSEIVEIQILFWEDLCEELAGDINLLKKYYPFYINNNNHPEQIDGTENIYILLQNFLNKRLEDIRRNHPSFRLMDIDETLFPNGTLQLNILEACDCSNEIKPISQIFTESWQRDKNNLIIIGEGGIGKTVTLLSLSASKGYLPHEVPAIYIQLHEIINNPEIKTIEDYIKISTLYRDTKQIGNMTMYEHILELARQPWDDGPRIILLIDGFNEIPAKYRKLIGAEIKTWAEMPGMQIVITSRCEIYQYISLRDMYYTINLQPLEKSVIEIYLQQANVAIPDTDALWNIIRFPLMLTLYVKTKYIIAQRDSHLFAWKNMNNAGTLIWNYLQCELWRFRNSTYMQKCVLATEFIAPYIAWKMQQNHRLWIEQSEFRCWLKESVELLKSTKEEQLPSHIQDIIWEENDRETDTKEFYTLLLQDLNLFILRDKVNVSLIHQQFRDCLAAIHLLNLLHIMPHGFPLPYEWRNSIDYYVMNFTSDLLKTEPTLVEKLLEANRNTKKTERISTINLLELLCRFNNYDFTEQNFSFMDLSKISLHKYRKPGETHIKLPVKAEKMYKTKISTETFMPEGHVDCISAVAITQDSRRMVSASFDSTLIIWDLNTGRALQVLEGHMGSVNDVVILPDEQQCISSSNDNTLRIWNMNTGECQKIIERHSGEVPAIALCPEGRHFASASKDGTICLWNLSDYRLLKILPIFEDKKTRCIIKIQTINNIYFICVSDSDDMIKIWDAAANIFLVPLIGYFYNINSEAMSPDGKYFVIATDDGLQVWDTCNGQCISDKPEVFNSIAVTSDSSKIVGGLEDGTIQILNIQTLEIIKSFNVIGECIHFLMMLSQNQCIVSSASKYQILDLDSSEIIHVLSGTYLQTGEVTLTPDSSRCICIDESLKIWNIKNGEHICSTEQNNFSIYAIAITPDKTKCVSATSDNLVRIWDITCGRLIGFLENPEYIIRSLIITSDSRQCIGISTQGIIQIWDINTRKIISSRKLADVWLSPASISLEGRLYAGVNHRTEYEAPYNQLQFWDITGTEIPCQIQNINCTSMVLSADGTELIYAINNLTGLGELQRLDLLNNKTELIHWKETNRNQHLANDQINSIAITPDKKTLAFGTCKEVIIWHENSKEVKFFPTQEWVGAIAISADGEYCISGSSYILSIWNITEGKHKSDICIIPDIDLLGVDLSQAEFMEEYTAKILYQNGAII